MIFKVHHRDSPPLSTYLTVKALHALIQLSINANTMALSDPYEMLLADIRSIIREEVSGLKQPEEKILPGIDFSEYILLKTAAEQLGISSQTLWNHKSRIGYSKQFGQILFKKEDLRKYIESGRPVPESRIKFTKYTRRKSGE